MPCEEDVASQSFLASVRIAQAWGRKVPAVRVMAWPADLPGTSWYVLGWTIPGSDTVLHSKTQQQRIGINVMSSAEPRLSAGGRHTAERAPAERRYSPSSHRVGRYSDLRQHPRQRAPETRIQLAAMLDPTSQSGVLARPDPRSTTLLASWRSQRRVGAG